MDIVSQCVERASGETHTSRHRKQLARHRAVPGSDLHATGSCLVMLGAKARGLVGFAAMAGSVLGTALQLQQPALWKVAAYAGLMAGALAGWLALQSLRRPVRGVMPMALLFGAIVGAGL